MSDFLFSVAFMILFSVNTKHLDRLFISHNYSVIITKALHSVTKLLCVLKRGIQSFHNKSIIYNLHSQIQYMYILYISSRRQNAQVTKCLTSVCSMYNKVIMRHAIGENVGTLIERFCVLRTKR